MSRQIDQTTAGHYYDLQMTSECLLSEHWLTYLLTCHRHKHERRHSRQTYNEGVRHIRV